jgi:hypothetical protein
MQMLASGADVECGPLPNPAFIWWKAQLLRRLDAQQEALAPIEVGDRVHFGVAVIAAIALAAIAWTRVPPAAIGPAALFAVTGASAVLVFVVGWSAWSEITGR